MRLRRLIEGGALLVLLAAGLGAQTACGKVGSLDQPAPMFGGRAEEEYRAQKAAEAADARRRANPTSNAIADQPDPTDNAPVTKRNLEAPEQRLTPLSQDPLPGTNADPRGAQPSMIPPN